jgi:hypothetical protein
MSRTPFQHVAAGESIQIPATEYNAMLDAAKAHRNRNVNLAPQGDGFGTLFVHVENATEQELQRFNIVGLDGPSVFDSQKPDDFCNRIIFKGVIPTNAHKGRFAVLQQDAAPNQIVRACVHGVTVAKVKTENKVEYCDIESEETEFLVTAASGVEVLWNDTSTEDNWAIIRIGGGGSGGQSAIYGIIMQAIEQPEDVTEEPPSGMGKVRIIGKKYPTEDDDGEPIEPEYDDCACLELAKTEKLLKGQQVKLIGPFEYDDPEPEDDDEPEKRKYYLAVETKGEYDGLPLEDDLEHDGESTIKVTDSDDEETEFTVHDGILKEKQTYPAGTHILVKRTAGKLYVVDGPCPEEPDDDDDPGGDP